MKLCRIHIGRLPGIDDPFPIEGLGDGFHTIVGPNGIGKSSLCRAARALLWKELGAEDRITASALFEHEGASWTVERDGTRHRWQCDGIDAEPPPLPADHLHRCFFLALRDLLESSSDAGRDVAAQIRRQMLGGFDLESAAESVTGDVGPRHGRGERSALSRLDTEVNIAERKQEALARRESELATLEGEAEESETARHELAHLERAIEVREQRGLRDVLERSLRELPEALASLTGTETEQLGERENELDMLVRRRERTARELKRAREDQAATRLEREVNGAELSAWRSRADHLADLEARLEEAQRQLDGERAALASASRGLGGHAEVPPEIDLEGDRDLFAFLRDAWQAEQNVESLRQRLELLVERAFLPEEQQRLELLRRAVEALRAWLRAPDPGAGFSPIGGRPRWQVVAAVGAALLLVGGGLAAAIDPALAALAGVGVGLAIGAWLFRPDPRAGYAREAAGRNLPTGIAPPSAWTVGAVGERLREFESELAALEASAARARDRDVERALLGKPLAAAEEQRSALDPRRQELAEALGLREIPADAELVDTTRALDELRQKHSSECKAAAQMDALAEQHLALLAQLSVALTGHGESEPPDAAAARAGVAHLADRDATFREARERQANLTQALEEIDGDVERVRCVIAKIYQVAALELDDRAGLVKLLNQLEGFHQSSRDRDALVKTIDQTESKLDAAGKSQLVDMDPAALTSKQSHCERQASKLEDLRSKISDIRAEVKHAREGHQLEDLLTERSDAAERLRDKRDEALRAAAGRYLLHTVRQEHETIQMPRVLARARQLFATFTHDAYELQVSPDNAGSFVAVEARSGVGRVPDELSDGTRVQLLLAARLAFAEETERGAKLPLFLDEALDQSDPIRFHAIARSLARLVADEDRQIFYLTNDPGDEQRIQAALRDEGCEAAHTIDLAAIRRSTRAVPDPKTLAVAPLPEVPHPAGQSPERYGVSLGIPPLDPQRGALDQHLFYLLHDDLGLLHDLLERRIEYVGQWQTLSRLHAEVVTELAAHHLVASELDARAELLAEFCRARSEGRGRPVDRAAIEASGSVTDRYLDAVCNIARELDGDGENLIEALRARDDGRLQGFRGRSTEALEQFLVDQGYIDPRPVFGEAEIVPRVMAAPAAARLPGAAAGEMVHRWCVVSRRADTRDSA